MSPQDVPSAIAAAFDAERVEVTVPHFGEELHHDHFVFADVRCALDTIGAVKEMGEDQAGNPKFEVTGPATDDRELSVICSFKPTGAVLLITVYEGTES